MNRLAPAIHRGPSRDEPEFVSALRRVVLAMFGTSVDTPSDFGIGSRKQGILTRTASIRRHHRDTW
jgi:hypothetical protein